MSKLFPFTFLGPATKCGINSRKVTKETCTEKEILKFSFAALKENNSPDESGSNRFSFTKLHSGKFLNEFLLRCGERLLKISYYNADAIAVRVCKMEAEQRF